MPQLNLFRGESSPETITLPQQFKIDTQIDKNPIRQLSTDTQEIPLEYSTAQIGRKSYPVFTVDGKNILISSSTIPTSLPNDTLIIKTPKSIGTTPESIINQLKSTRSKWVKPLPISQMSDEVEVNKNLTQAVLNSWEGVFSYKQDNPIASENGLRTPQIGALHAVLAHWSISEEIPSTIVMPTGTGKTETMLSLLINQRLNNLLVIVPTNALRDQLSKKFETLGILKKFGIVNEEANYPIVGRLKHRFTSLENAERFMSSCNVVIATMASINTNSVEVKDKIVDISSCLIIDEAHHVSAPTWEEFKMLFKNKKILQFTATPFRNDGKYVGGKIVYAYPLGKAQEEEYFTKINFSPVYAYTDQDTEIAKQAIEVLKKDLTSGLNHIIMARTDTIQRANEVFEVYSQIAGVYQPLLIHSQLSDSKKKEALKQLSEGTSRIIVCVDMLGEGFDLPELKIAAIHDLHKSLAITLQFTGRFTRVNRDKPIGEATIVVNIADVNVSKQIKGLYAEDADWDKLIKDYSQHATVAEQRRSEFLHAFVKLPDEISVQNIEPRMSTVVYKSHTDDWDPDKIKTIFPEEKLYTKEIAINPQFKVAWFVTEEHTKIKWGNMKGIDNVTYDLYVVFWYTDKKLLFINSSNNSSLHEELAKAILNNDAEIIKGAEMYRSMNNIKRLLPINLGLSDITSRTVRFTMFAGSDVGAGLDQSQGRSKTKTNMFGFGYENGEKVSIGCSQKGRVWSYLVANDIGQWINWCKHIGLKLIDSTIDLDSIYGQFVRPGQLDARPPYIPLTVEWPLQLLQALDIAYLKTNTNEEYLLHDISLDVTDHTNSGPIKFNVTTPTNKYEYQIDIVSQRTVYTPLNEDLKITIGKNERSLSDYLNSRPLRIIFEGDKVIDDDLFFEFNSEIPPFDVDKINTQDWTGIDLQKESQGLGKESDSIQRKVIENLKSNPNDWDIIFDDDGSGEVADIVAIKTLNDRLIVHLFHCKYSSSNQAGARVDDLYAVCGQANKSIMWRERSEELIPHLIERERKRIIANSPSRLEKGQLKDLSKIGWEIEQLQKDFKIFIVQPGLSKSQVSDSILNLLGSTSLYLNQTFNVPFEVISSQ